MSDRSPEIQGNKMGSMPVNKLLINMAMPMMLSMLGQALYNVVDTFFVSHMEDTAEIVAMGDKAINALTLAFPIQMLIIALGVGTGVGINSVLARCLGRGERERAGLTAGNALFACICYYIGIFIFGIVGARAFIESQTNDPLIAEMGITYLQIVTTCSFGAIGYMCVEKIVMATGNTVVTMISQLMGAITNIVLDPIMIYGLAGVPAMGVAGAAWATIIGQCVSFIIVVVLHFMRNREIDNRLKYLIPVGSVMKDIYKIGAPAIVMQILSPIMSYGLNLILGSISASAVTAYGLYFKLQNFIFMPAYGLNNAIIPIVSFNYGAKNKERITGAIKSGLIVMSGIMIVGTLLLQIFANQVVGIFSVSDESAEMCVLALRIITCGFVFVGINIILQGICQALGNGFYSLIISLMRMLIIVLPLAFVLSRLSIASTAVWFALPISETIACIAAFYFAKRMYNYKVKLIANRELA